MKQNYKKLLTNIYFLAKHHKELNGLLMNDLMRDDLERRHSRGLFDAYAYIVQMVEHSQSIGTVNYKKVFKMEGKLPTIYT